MKPPKTAQTIGLLGIFLGWTGIHDWFLNRKKNAIIHAALAGGSILLVLIAGIILQVTAPTLRILPQISVGARWGNFFTTVGYLVAAGNIIWGIVEGVLILHRGDKALPAQLASIPSIVHPQPKTPAQQPTTPAQPATPAQPTPATPSAPAAQTASTQSGPTTTSAQATTAQSASTPAQQPKPAQPAATQPAPTVVAAQPPKQPLNPATKKKIILGSAIGGGVLLLAIIAWVVIALVTRIDYGDTYRVANELRAKVNDIYQDYGCSRAVDYADSTWVSERTYNSYVSDCKEVLDGVEDLVKKLSETSGVKRNDKISSQFKSFQEAYHAAIPDVGTIDEKLDLYQTWHTFTVKVDDLTAKSSDADFKSAADVLAKSGNPTMTSYGEGWLERSLAYAHAYQAYWDAPSDASNKTQLRNDMNNKQSEQRLWVSENRPDITELVGLEFNNTSKMYNSYRTLFSTIADAYENHYNFGSGDCTELFDEVVICE